jgi:hypothetical protein
VIEPTLSRRQLLQGAACGFGALALAGLGAAPAASATTPTHGPHLAPRAKRVIFLFMQGGISQVDSFDPKPRLDRDDGQQMPFDDARSIANSGRRAASAQRIMKSPWAFAKHGACGRPVSALFPEIARHADRLCFLHGVTTEGVAHGPATLFLHCGASTSVRPSMGSWVLYGLGTENANLPGFVTIAPSSGNGGARNYGSAFLPASVQGTPLGRAGGPASALTFPHLDGPENRRTFDLVRGLNRLQRDARPAADTELDAVIASYELAWRMQAEAPGVLDLSRETKATRDLYGIDGSGSPTDTFGRQCLLARRFAEGGVRFIQVTYGDGTANPAWDQHSNLPKHADHARAVDRPVAGLLADLAARGLLDDTLVWFGSEFGRTPYAEKNGTGRDHNPGGFTVWLAGGGVKPGFAHGATDEFGHQAVEGRVPMHDLHATILHLLGLDHERLTFRHSGRDFRLTDVHGRVVSEILA